MPSRDGGEMPDMLRQEAIRFRDQLNSSKGAASSLHCLKLIERFPRGCCKVASMLLAHHLVTRALATRDIIQLCANGERDEQTHAWLCVNRWIVDITCGQFPDCAETTIVAASSRWHDGFARQRLYTYEDFMDMHADYRKEFNHLYSQVTRFVLP